MFGEFGVDPAECHGLDLVEGRAVVVADVVVAWGSHVVNLSNTRPDRRELSPAPRHVGGRVGMRGWRSGRDPGQGPSLGPHPTPRSSRGEATRAAPAADVDTGLAGTYSERL